MLREERQARILEYVQNRHYASVDELMAMLGVSKATIRRDLTALGASNALLLTRGGATCDVKDHYSEMPYIEKSYANAAEKSAIGEAASCQIQNGQAIIVDAGTTTRSMTPFLKERKGVNCVTNDIAIASDLMACPGINVLVTGGQLRMDFYTLRGYVAEEMIGNTRADIAFLGFDAIDVNSGCFITNVDEVMLKRRILSVADRTVAVCDHTKFTTTAFISVCGFSDIDTIITDEGADPQHIQTLREMGVEVILAPL